MTDTTRMTRERRRPIVVVASIVVLVVVLSMMPVGGGATLGGRFFGALRIARPQAVTAPSAPGNLRSLQAAVVGLVADSATVVRDEADQAVTTLTAASTAAGFPGLRLARRSDAPVITVLGEHALGATVNRSLLVTVFREAGRPDIQVPESLDNAPIVITTKRGVRLQYGNCPVPPAATIANQINGPPPPSSDNSNCVVLVEEPRALTVVPRGLDSTAVLAIALELAGMSPNQSRDFQQLFSWSGGVALSPPRFVRSHELVTVGGKPGILMVTGGRRGPTYALIWASNDLLFTLTGYGSPGDAAALAASAAR